MKYIKVEDALKIVDEGCGEFRGISGRIRERLETVPPALVIDMDKYEALREELYFIHDQLETLKLILQIGREIKSL